MKRIVDVLGYIVLLGILIKLSFVFFSLFGKLDNDSWFSKLLGITFSFASVYFVVKVKQNWLKKVMVFLDCSIILWYYFSEMFVVDPRWIAVVIAFYSGLIIYYLGKQLSLDIFESDTVELNLKKLNERIVELENCLQGANKREVELERVLVGVKELYEVRRQIASTTRNLSISKTEISKEKNRVQLIDLQNKERELEKLVA